MRIPQRLTVASVIWLSPPFGVWGRCSGAGCHESGGSSSSRMVNRVSVQAIDRPARCRLRKLELLNAAAAAPHSGEISIETEAGKGTTVWIKIPLSQIDELVEDVQRSPFPVAVGND